jgi:hypothetical protein
MKTFLIIGAAALLFGAQRPSDDWTREFGVDKSELVSTGRNPYFILEPGRRLTLEHGAERLVITVLPDIRVVDGVETRVVEERETNNGKLVEISRNFYAISKRTNSVFYFGEEVDVYRNDRITGHEGSWVSGVGGARFGLMMPGLPLLRARYYQEVAPKLAMDRAEIILLRGDTLRTEETTPLEPGHKEYKVYAAGVGLIQDGDLTLVKREDR